MCKYLVVILILTGLAGCTSHPAGEKELRQTALESGKQYDRAPDERPAPPLAENPSPDELVRYALLTNPDLERKYWEWRSAIEQIPQDGTQPTNLVLFGGVPITNGSTAFDRTTVTIANDPMNDILWPSKPATAAKRALQNAKAAGERFQKAKYELRKQVLDAYYDYALNAEMIRLEQANIDLLKSIALVIEARNRAGAGGQQDVLKAHNEVDLSVNGIEQMRSQLLSQRASINSLVDRPPNAKLVTPTTLPATAPLSQTDQQLLELAAARNPELGALAQEVGARNESIKLAKLQYLPDFSVSASTDLGGMAQNLMGMVTVPILRREAIEAAIAQAQANLRVTELMRRQTQNDLQAQVILDIVGIRDADRQLDLFEHMILPRARQAVTVGRVSYESGRSSLLEFLDSQRSLISIERLVANLQITREKQIADLEGIIARSSI